MNTSTLLVSFIPIKGTMEYRPLKNTYLQRLSEIEGIEHPLIMKEVQRQTDCDSWQEYRFEMLRQIESVEYKGANYVPLHPTGSSRSVVAFIHSALEDKLLGLVSYAEEAIAYLKAATTTEYPYGIHELKSVRVYVRDDEIDGQLTDGLGYISTDLFFELGYKNIIQMRCFQQGGNKPGIAKGLLKVDSSLPERSICFSKSQLKGRVHPEDWAGQVDLDLGVLRKFEGPPPTAKSSWSFTEFWHDIRDSEIKEAKDRARDLCDTLKDPKKLSDFRGLSHREEDAMGILEKIIDIAARSSKSSSRFPSLEFHPFVQTQVEGICASRLRHLAISGAKEFSYPVVTEVMTKEPLKWLVKTLLYPPGTEVCIMRYPILEGRNVAYGVVVGPSDSLSEVSCGYGIAQICAMDSDGDAVIITDEPRRVELARRLRDQEQEVIHKNHRRLKSSLYELPDVLIKNLFSAGVGTATLCTVACELSNDQEGRRFAAELTQACTDSVKFSVDTREGRREAKRLLDEYGLPDHLAHKNSPQAFKSVEATVAFSSSPLWFAIASVYKEEMGNHRESRLPTRAYSNVLGKLAFHLDREQSRELTRVYRWYAQKAREVHLSESEEEEKRRRFNDLYDSLLIWKSKLKGNKRDWAAGAWMISHSSSDSNAVGAFAFRVFGDEVISMLREVYLGRELASSEISDSQKTLQPFPAESFHPLNDTSELSSTSKTFGVVNIPEELTPEQASEIIKNGEVTLEPSGVYLPAREDFGLELKDSNGRTLGEVVHADLDGLSVGEQVRGDVEVNAKSLKVAMV